MMEKTEKKDYLNKVYLAARMAGMCHNKGEFAEIIGTNPSSLSKAFSGDDNYLTDNFIRRLKLWESQVLKKKTEPEPEPDIVIPARTFDMFKNMSEAIRLQAEMLARMGAGTTPGYTSPKNFRIETK